VAVRAATVLVVDDYPPFREWVREFVARAGFVVVEAGDADEALAAIAQKPPDLVLLDVILPRVTGYELFRELRDRLGEGVPIIFVSGQRIDAYDRVAGLLLGAEDYLVKPIDPDELLARIRRSLRVAAAGESAAETGARSRTALLTTREREVLSLLASGYSSPEIARSLVISPLTVRTHMQRILRKLDVNTRAQAVAVAYRAGLAGAAPGAAETE
jgi:DNA-binding NarL/FixJ family response regulator